MRLRLVVALLGLAATCVLLTSAPSSDGRAARADRWCGSLGPKDWLCRDFGEVRLDGNRVGRRARRMWRGQRVWVDAASRGLITFRRTALCALGGSGAVTEATVRPPGRRGRVTLLRQLSGASSCTTARGRKIDFGFFCGFDGRCPALLRADGTVINHRDRSGGAAASSAVERVTSTICTGSYRVRVESDGGYAESAGGSNLGGVVRIRFVRTADSVDLFTDYVVGRACDRGVVRRQVSVIRD